MKNRQMTQEELAVFEVPENINPAVNYYVNNSRKLDDLSKIIIINSLLNKAFILPGCNKKTIPTC